MYALPGMSVFTNGNVMYIKLENNSSCRTSKLIMIHTHIFINQYYIFDKSYPIPPSKKEKDKQHEHGVLFLLRTYQQLVF